MQNHSPSRWKESVLLKPIAGTGNFCFLFHKEDGIALRSIVKMLFHNKLHIGFNDPLNEGSRYVDAALVTMLGMEANFGESPPPQKLVNAVHKSYVLQLSVSISTGCRVRWRSSGVVKFDVLRFPAPCLLCVTYTTRRDEHQFLHPCEWKTAT